MWEAVALCPVCSTWAGKHLPLNEALNGPLRSAGGGRSSQLLSTGPNGAGPYRNIRASRIVGRSALGGEVAVCFAVGQGQGEQPLGVTGGEHLDDRTARPADDDAARLLRDLGRCPDWSR